MPTYYPSWLPDVTDAPDLEADYEATIPEQWPAGLIFPETDVYTDREAFGVAFSWVAYCMWLVKNRYFPQDDVDGVFLGDWERDLALASSGTIAQRQARILAKVRARGTGNEDVILSIMAPAYGVPGGSTALAFCTPDLSTVIADNPPASDPGWLDAFVGHFYGDGTLTLDEDMADDTLAAITPAGWHWGAGETQYFKADTVRINRGVVK